MVGRCKLSPPSGLASSLPLDLLCLKLGSPSLTSRQLRGLITLSPTRCMALISGGHVVPLVLSGPCFSHRSSRPTPIERHSGNYMRLTVQFLTVFILATRLWEALPPL